MKRVLKIVFLTALLCIAMSFNALAKGEVQKITKTVNPTGGTGSPITIITANKFLVDEGLILFEFESKDTEYLSNAFCVISTGDVEEGGGEWIQDDNGTFFARQYTSGEWECGKHTINLQITNYNSELVYNASFTIEICESFDLLGEMEGLGVGERETISKYDDSANVYLDSLNEIYPSKIAIADKSGKIYMATENADNIYSGSTYMSNVYYADVFKEESRKCLEGIDGYYVGGYLMMARPLTAGVYDYIVYNEAGTASAKIEDAIVVTDKPAIEFNSNSDYLQEPQKGDKSFWIGTSIKGTSPSVINKISMFDNNGNLFAQSTGEYIVENYYYHERYVVFEMKAVSEGFKFGSYRVEIDTDEDIYCSSDRLYLSENTSSNVYINRVKWSSPEIANFVVQLSDSNPSKQYKFELRDNKNAVISEEYANVSTDGQADLEFKDAEGNVIAITPQQRYSLYFYSKENGGWKKNSQYSFSTYYRYTGSSSAAQTTFSAYVDVYSGVVEASLYMPQSMQSYYSGNNFVIKVRSISGEEYTYTPTVERGTLKNGGYYIYLEVPNAKLPDGHYTASLYYNSNEVVPYEDWYNFSMTTPDATYYSDGINRVRYIRRIAFDNIQTITNPTLKLYNIYDGDFIPECTISLVKNSNEYLIPSTASFDRTLAYYYEIIANGEVYGAEFNEGVYFASQVYDASKNCTITVKQTANGTTSVSNTNPKVGDTVYVTAKADEGYQYSPVSVKVNGVRIQGRSFVVFADATVEVEYREIPEEMFKATVQNYSSSYGEIAIEKDYYKKGETVKVSVKFNDSNYKLNQLRYRDANYNWTNIDLTTMSFKMPEGDVVIEAGYTRKSSRSIYKQSYSDFNIYTYYQGNTTSYVTEGEQVTVTAYLNSTRTELPASEFEELYYVYANDTTEKKHTIYNGKFTMPDENIRIYATLKKRPINVEVVGRGTVEVTKGYNTTVTEAYATEKINIQGKGEGSFYLTGIEVNGVLQTGNSFEMPIGADANVKAIFTSDKFMKISIVSGEHGTAWLDKTNWEYSDGFDHYYGRAIKINVKPEQGYKVSSVLVEDTDIAYSVKDGVVNYSIDEYTDEIVVNVEFEQTHYEVIYVDDNNQIITTQYYELGKTGVYDGATPYKAPDGTNAYIFNGWDKEEVTGADTVKAIFTAVPYTTISTEEQLKTISGDGYYVLANDITLTEKWTPIETFKGVLDGNGHKISNIDPVIVDEYHTISLTTTYHAGFFKYLSGTVINTAFEVAGSGVHNNKESLYVGGIASEMGSSRIENCYVKGTMNYSGTGYIYVGAMAGYVYSADVRNCYTEADIYAQSDAGAYVAGLAYVSDNIELATSYGNSTVNCGSKGKAYIFVNDYNRAYSCFYNSEKRNGATQFGATALTTSQFKLLSSYVYSNKCTWDFGKVWSLDSELNGGLPSLKIFGTNQTTVKTSSATFETGELKASLKFSQPVSGEVFTLVRSGNKSIFKQVITDNVVDSVDLRIETNKVPDELKVVVWENFANIKPIVMETLDVE